jgi:hypothetical protein
MTKYTVASQRRARTEERTLSPIWRGIGCLLIVLIPVVSYLLAVWIVGLAVQQNWPMPYQLMGFPNLPAVLSSTGLAPVVDFIESRQDLYAILLITIVVIVVLGTLLSLIYSVIYRVVGPPRYGPLDAPPPKVGIKRYKR